MRLGTIEIGFVHVLIARFSSIYFCSWFTSRARESLFLLPRPIVLRAICHLCTLRLDGWWIYSLALPLIVICASACKLIVVVMWQICLWILNANVSLTSRDKHKRQVTMYCDTSFYVVHQYDGRLIETSTVWNTSVTSNEECWTH